MKIEDFIYREGNLYAEGVSVADLAAQYGTPLYVYSAAHFRAQYEALTKALAGLDPLICYSVKANSNAGVIREFMGLGSGVDIVSGGELFRARRAGMPPARFSATASGSRGDLLSHSEPLRGGQGPARGLSCD